MINVAIDLCLLLACASIVALRFLGLRRPPLTGWSAEAGDSRVGLSLWVTLGALLGGLFAGARLRFDLDAHGSQGPVNGGLLLVTLVVVVVAASLWAFRTYRRRDAR